MRLIRCCLLLCSQVLPLEFLFAFGNLLYRDWCNYLKEFPFGMLSFNFWTEFWNSIDSEWFHRNTTQTKNNSTKTQLKQITTQTKHNTNKTQPKQNTTQTKQNSNKTQLKQNTTQTNHNSNKTQLKQNNSGHITVKFLLIPSCTSEMISEYGPASFQCSMSYPYGRPLQYQYLTHSGLW